MGDRFASIMRAPKRRKARGAAMEGRNGEVLDSGVGSNIKSGKLQERRHYCDAGYLCGVWFGGSSCTLYRAGPLVFFFDLLTYPM